MCVVLIIIAVNTSTNAAIGTNPHTITTHVPNDFIDTIADSRHC